NEKDMKRLALIGASLVLVGGITAACGSDDDKTSGADLPSDASTEEFCAAMLGFAEVSEDKEKFDGALAGLSKVGTPEEIDGDARKGFELFVDALNDIDSDELANVAEPDFDEDEEKQYLAFQSA